MFQDDYTALHIATRLGDVNSVNTLLQNGAKPDCVTSDLYTPLHIAAKEGQLEIAQILLDSGANQKLATKVWNLAWLHILIVNRHLKNALLINDYHSNACSSCKKNYPKYDNDNCSQN